MILDAIKCGKRNSKVDEIAPTIMYVHYHHSYIFKPPAVGWWIVVTIGEIFGWWIDHRMVIRDGG